MADFLFRVWFDDTSILFEDIGSGWYWLWTFEGDLMTKLTVTTPHGTTTYASNLGPWVPAKLMVALNDLKTQSKQSRLQLLFLGMVPLESELDLWFISTHGTQKTPSRHRFPASSRSRGPIFWGGDYSQMTQIICGLGMSGFSILTHTLFRKNSKW
jgi:hypothetical protein